MPGVLAKKHLAICQADHALDDIFLNCGSIFSEGFCYVMKSEQVKGQKLAECVYTLVSAKTS
jgi:hypothetical protein